MDVNFIRYNPAMAGMQQAQQIDNQGIRNEFLRMQVEGAREQARQDRAASEALNRIYATGENLNSGDVNRRLAADPSLSGARRLDALQSAEAQDIKRTQIDAQAREREARIFKQYVDNGLYAAASEQAKKMGMNIPADFWANKEKVDALREKLDLEDKRAGINQKNAAAGASIALAASRKPDPYEDFVDNEGRVFRRNKADGKGDYVRDPDGNPIVVETKRGVAEVGADARRDVAKTQAEARAQGGGAGGRPLNIIARRQMLEEAGYSPQEAAALAAGGSITPAQRAQISERVRNSVGRMQGRTGLPLTPAEQAAEVRRREAEIFSAQRPSNQAATRQADGAPIAPKDAADVPRGQDGRVDHRQLVDGQVYLIPLKKGGQTTGRWNAQTGRFDEVN